MFFFEMLTTVLIVAMSFGFVLKIIAMAMAHKLRLEKIRHGYPLDERYESRGARHTLPDDYDYAAPAAERLQ